MISRELLPATFGHGDGPDRDQFRCLEAAHFARGKGFSCDLTTR